MCFILLKDCAGNSHFVQTFMQKFDFWQLVNVKGSSKMQLRALSLLSSLMKGINLTINRIFIENGGFSDLINKFKEIL